MKVVCPHCQGKARINSRTNLNAEKTIVDLYCNCFDVENCGATFVFTLAFKNTLCPPLKTVRDIASEILRLSPALDTKNPCIRQSPIGDKQQKIV
jgi:hypothetical protein